MAQPNVSSLTFFGLIAETRTTARLEPRSWPKHEPGRQVTQLWADPDGRLWRIRIDHRQPGGQLPDTPQPYGVSDLHFTGLHTAIGMKAKPLREDGGRMLPINSDSEVFQRLLDHLRYDGETVAEDLEILKVDLPGHPKLELQGTPIPREAVRWLAFVQANGKVLFAPAAEALAELDRQLANEFLTAEDDALYHAVWLRHQELALPGEANSVPYLIRVVALRAYYRHHLFVFGRIPKATQRELAGQASQPTIRAVEAYCKEAAIFAAQTAAKTCAHHFGFEKSEVADLLAQFAREH